MKVKTSIKKRSEDCKIVRLFLPYSICTFISYTY